MVRRFRLLPLAKPINLSSIEWMEFRSLHGDAVASLQGAADSAMLTVQATNALRALFARAKLL